MHCIFEALCQRYTRDALGLHSGKEQGKTKKAQAFNYNFRLPSVFAAPDLQVPSFTLALENEIQSGEDDDDDDFEDEDGEPSFGNYVLDTPGAAAARAANASILADIEKTLKPKWENQIPLIHRRLKRSMDGDIEIERQQLLGYLKGRLLEPLRYVCTDVACIPLNSGRLTATKLAEALVTWVSPKQVA
jgi:hypothetical protein